MSKKIIHQISLSDIGGVQKSFALYLLYAQKKSSFSHSIFSMHNLIQDFFIIKKYHNCLNNSLINKLKFIFYIFSKKFIIHFYNNLGSYYVYRMLKITPSSNIIFHERGNVWNAKNEDLNIYKFNSKKAKIILANSIATKTILIKRFSINENKIKVVYNGFFSKNFNYPINENLRLSNKFSIGYLGRLDTPKGVHILINAAKELKAFDFFIAGTGILENKLKELARNISNIKFLGSFHNPLEFISKMDTMVVPSIREPLGNIIIESGYAKKPVIATNVDGIAEIIKNGFSGILINPDKEISFKNDIPGAVPLPKFVINPDTLNLQKPKEIDHLKLCDAINLLSKNQKIREKYGENLYQTVRYKFNIENYFKNIEKIYSNIEMNIEN